MPKYLNINKNNTEDAKNKICNAFFLNVKSLTFNENKGISAFIT